MIPKRRKPDERPGGRGGSGVFIPATLMRKRSSSSEIESGDAAMHLREEQNASKYEAVTPTTPYNGGDLSAANIRRLPGIYKIPLNEIHVPSYAIEPDEVFVRQYKEYLLGHASAYFTRVSEKDIFAGYYRSDTVSTPITQTTPDELIDERCAEIRSGRRPTVFLRENRDVANAPRFFCCDSIISLTAYRRVGISLIPVAIVSRTPPVNLEHSAFETNVAINLGDENPRVTGFHPCSVRALRATRLDGLNSIEALLLLEKNVRDVIKKIRDFHLDGCEIFHYHDTLYSTLVRTRDYLQGAICLLKEGLSSQAISLYRSLYELHINFYVDWLAPENAWMELAYAANIDSRYLRALEKDLKQDFSKGRSPQRAEQLTKRTLLLARWLSVVKSKASFAPVGIALHDVYYGDLSRVQHQGFSETASHANRFRSETYQVVDEDYQNWLCQLVNITVTETLELVGADVGEPA